MSGSPGTVEARGPWALAFAAFYRLVRVLDPPIRAWWRRFGLADTVELVVRGRRSGRPRSVLVGLLVVGGRSYVGHPSGDSGWTRNLRAAGRAVVVDRRGRGRAVRATLLAAGRERSAAIEATWQQHPWPARPLYRAARSHILRFGVYFRLDPDIETVGLDEPAGPRDDPGRATGPAGS